MLVLFEYKPLWSYTVAVTVITPVPALLKVIAPVVHVFEVLELLAVNDPLVSTVSPLTSPIAVAVALSYKYDEVLPASVTLRAIPAIPFASDAVTVHLMYFFDEPPKVLLVLKEVIVVPTEVVLPYEPPTALIVGAV